MENLKESPATNQEKDPMQEEYKEIIDENNDLGIKLTRVEKDKIIRGDQSIEEKIRLLKIANEGYRSILKQLEEAGV